MPITVKRPRGTVVFCQDLNLAAEHEAAEAALAKARSKANTEMLARPNFEAEIKHIQDLEERMRQENVVFTLQGIRRKRWQEIAAENPPREGNRADLMQGVNRETFYDAIAVEPGSIISVVNESTGAVEDFDPKTEWVALADEMTDGQYLKFAEKFLELNREASEVPFSEVASLLTRPSDANFE